MAPPASGVGAGADGRLAGTSPLMTDWLLGLRVLAQVTAGVALVHADLSGDALPQLGYVADDADHPASPAQPVAHGHHLVQGLLVRAAEALVDEQRLDPGPARLGGDHVG